MRVVFPHREGRVIDNYRLSKNLIGGKKFETLSPAWLFISGDELHQLRSLLYIVIKKAYLVGMPPRIRVDTVCVDGKMKVLEINSDIPAGTFFLLNSLLAYGCFAEARRMLACLHKMFDGKIPVFLRENAPSALASPHEFAIMKEFFPEAIEAFVEDDWLVYCDESRYRIWRAVGTEYGCDLSAVPFNALNHKRSALASPKCLLEGLDSPILPSCYTKLVAEGEEFIVPEGWVAKGDKGLGGKQVFFTGETVPSDLYLVQEFLELPSRFMGGKVRQYGVDFVFMGNEIFAFGRCCTLGERLLNISSGGGIIPMEVIIT